MCNGKTQMNGKINSVLTDPEMLCGHLSQTLEGICGFPDSSVVKNLPEM